METTITCERCGIGMTCHTDYISVTNADGERLGNIFCANPAEDWGKIADGACPICDGWEDGLGHACTADGWSAREGENNMKIWNGTDATGRYQYPVDDINYWNMTIDERGTVYYIPHDGTDEPLIWCPAADLTRHLHKLEQIAAR